MDVIPLSLVIVFCIACSAFFSSTETAFTTVNRLRMKILAESGEKVNCLIYLSDGYGRFPEEKPQGYETFFVLDRYLYGVQDEYEEESEIPGWVTRLYL